MISFRSTAFLSASLLLATTATACVMPVDVESETKLIDNVWELQQIQFNDGKLLEANPPENYTIDFSPNGEVFVQADCNRAVGSFTLEDGIVSITMGPTTLAACPEGSIGTEFLQSLNNANLYFFQDGDLFVDLAFDSGTMQFSPAGATATTGSLTGKVWQLQDIQFNDGTLLVADPPENYTVEFLEDGTLAMQADCNRGQSLFVLRDDNRLIVEPIATTLAACPEESISNDFIRAMENSAIYFFQDGNLFIDLIYDGGTMRFAEAPTTPALVGTVWKLQQIQYNDGKLLTANPPENYTVQFMEDGTLAMQADCNQGQGAFTTNADNRLTVEDLATTRAACPEGSISNDFITAMQNSAIFFFQDGDLFIDIIYGSGTMKFSAD
ncbi:MAG: META domain-containing protein [Leptolyngbyaceae cyanobacterium SM2_5_2]|nr:META domain-containing protein [Leptolyngbyaceae cyanobacterium SM2_5_2]